MLSQKVLNSELLLIFISSFEDFPLVPEFTPKSECAFAHEPSWAPVSTPETNPDQTPAGQNSASYGKPKLVMNISACGENMSVIKIEYIYNIIGYSSQNYN